MLHLRNKRWPTIGFISAAVLGIAFASVAILGEGVNSTKASWLALIMVFAMIMIRRTGKVQLPKWRRSGKTSH